MKIKLSQPLTTSTAGRILSEKLDGVRCYWNGKSLISRNDNVFNAPAWFREQLPVNVPLVGELWAGRGRFGDVISTIQSKSADWKNIRFMIFDIVDPDMRFEQSQEKLKGLRLPDHCAIVTQIKCENRKHLDAFHQDVIEKGGEGVMLRRPGSYYHQDQSVNYIKVKQLSTDEAVLRDYTTNKKGTLAALVCEWKGKLIKIGTGLTDRLRLTPPPVGSSITFSFEGLTINNIPRFAVFVGVRNYE